MDRLKSLLDKIIRVVKEIVVVLFVPMFQILFRQCVRLNTWLRFGRHYDAPLKPFELYRVDPDNIKTKTESLPSRPKYCGTLEGDWDLVQKDRDETPTYVSFKRKFFEDANWEDTFEYKNAVQIIESGDTWNGCNSVSDIGEYFGEYDELFDSIKQNGYKSQRELDTQGNPTKRLHDIKHHPPELREVTVDITRNGECILSRGGHRVAMARLLDVEKIPVRVRLRHEKWQTRRDDMWNKSVKNEKHFDLQF